ncbi:MAG: hypothetical protein KY455_02425 [Euryarchaeota archaeon]|nr:hypothetical protein [Euryarchaeota archaeon]
MSPARRHLRHDSLMDPLHHRTNEDGAAGTKSPRAISDTSLRISVCGGGDARQAIASTAARVLRDRGMHVHIHQYGRDVSLLETGHLHDPDADPPILTDCNIVSTDLPSTPDLLRLHKQVVRPHYVLSDGFGAAPGLPGVVLRRRARALTHASAGATLIVAARDPESLIIIRDEAARAGVDCITISVKVDETPGMEDLHLIGALLEHWTQEGLSRTEATWLESERIRAHALRDGPTAGLRWYHAASLHDSGALWDRLNRLVAITDRPIDLVARATADGPFAPGLWGSHIMELDRRGLIGRVWVSGPGAGQLRRFVARADLRIVGDGAAGVEQVLSEAGAVPGSVLVTIGDPDPFWMGGLLARLRGGRVRFHSYGDGSATMPAQSPSEAIGMSIGP